MVAIYTRKYYSKWYYYYSFTYYLLLNNIMLLHVTSVVFPPLSYRLSTFRFKCVRGHGNHGEARRCTKQKYFLKIIAQTGKNKKIECPNGYFRCPIGQFCYPNGKFWCPNEHLTEKVQKVTKWADTL